MVGVWGLRRFAVPSPEPDSGFCIGICWVQAALALPAGSGEKTHPAPARIREYAHHHAVFFNLAGAIYDPDNEGVVLETMSEARLMAATLSAEMLQNRPRLAWLGEEFRVEVT